MTIWQIRINKDCQLPRGVCKTERRRRKAKVEESYQAVLPRLFSGGPVVGLKKCFKNMFHPHVHLHVEICANMFML